MSAKSIRVSEYVYNWLNSRGKVTDSFDDVIRKLIKFFEENSDGKDLNTLNS